MNNKEDFTIFIYNIKTTIDMNEDFIEKMLNLYTWDALATFGPDTFVVLNPEMGVYENNHTIEEYKSKGYKLCDANCFGIGDRKYEALTFRKVKTE